MAYEQVEGSVAGFREGSEEDPLGGQRGSLQVWNFRVESYDVNGDLVDVVPVQMKGRSFTGTLHDGDRVRLVLPDGHGREEAVEISEVVRVVNVGGEARTQVIRARTSWPSPRIAAVIAIAMVAAFVLFVLWGMGEVNKPPPSLPTQSGGPTTVPEVTGFEVVRASVAMADAGLQIVLAEEASSTVPFGRVVRTEPAAGAVLEAGDRVTLVVSTGP